MPLPPKPRPAPGRPPRPSRARDEAGAPPPRKKPPLALFGGIAAGAAALIVLLFVALGGKKEKDPAPTLSPKAAPRPVEPDYLVRVHHVDAGITRQITLFVAGTGKGGPEGYLLTDAQGREHKGRNVDPLENFYLERQRDPGIAVRFTVPREAETLDVTGPGGKKLSVARPAGPDALKPLATPCLYEGWDIACSGTLSADFVFDLEIRARKAADDAEPLKPAGFFLVTDEGKALAPEVRSASPPFRLRYKVPPATKELRLQTFFRGEKPLYLVHPVTPKEAPAPVVKPEPATPKPPDAAKPPAGSLKADFDAKASDPVEAIKFLAGKNTDEAKALAREAVVRFVNDDLAAGLKAFGEGKADLAEKHLARAALLAEAYSPEFSRQLVRMIFLLKQPRKVPTGCAACKGAGSSACGSCKSGLAQGNCPRCEAKGSVNCLLCDASGTMDHHGYKGRLLLTVASDTPIRYQGARGTLHGQTVRWDMSPCAGAGFHLRTTNTITCQHKNDPKVPPIKFDGNKPCGEFWNEMKMFVFNGKAKVQIMGRRGEMLPFSSTAARRFLADYEICKSGRVTCDLCTGRKTETCGVCSGKGQATLLCSGCEGTSLQACPTCKGYGDASWLAKFLPTAPDLQAQLGQQAGAIREWLDDRSRRTHRKQDLERRFQESQKGLDASAKLTDDLLDVTCARCQGKGGECEDCWGTGRREYFAGTGPYERYALARRLKRQVDEASQTAAAAPPYSPIASSAPGAAPVAVAPRPPPVVNPGVPGALPSTLVVPKTVDEIMKMADELHETGKKHLEIAKATTDQALWVDEAVKALNDLRNAQTLYASAQEKLDETGAAVPRELQTKFRINMQALLMARRTAP